MTSPSDIPRFGALQVDQDMGFQRRMWRIQRIGWAVLFVVALLAILGVAGDGPLSEASSSSGTIEVQYARVERHRSPSTLVVWVSTDAADNGKVQVWIGRDFADRLRTEGITPEPESVETSDSRVTYTFEVDDKAPLARVSFAVMHQGMGFQRAEAGIAGGPTVSFRQLVLP